MRERTGCPLPATRSIPHPLDEGIFRVRWRSDGAARGDCPMGSGDTCSMRRRPLRPLRLLGYRNAGARSKPRDVTTCFANRFAAPGCRSV